MTGVSETLQVICRERGGGKPHHPEEACSAMLLVATHAACGKWRHTEPGEFDKNHGCDRTASEDVDDQPER